LTPPAVECRGLAKSYGAAPALAGIDLAVAPGEDFGLLGPNGAGKTTTLRLLLDLIRPTRGQAFLFGRPTSDPAARARVGFLPDEPALDEGLTGRGTLDFFDALRPRGAPAADPARREDLGRRLGLTGEDMDRPVRDDSRGTRQKIALLAALQRDPDLLILDEPTTGLDPLVREALFAILLEARGRGRTVLLSSHVLSEVERVCGRVAILRAGRLAALKTVEEIRRTAARRMVVHFAGPVPSEELDLPGVALLQRDGGRVVLKVSGDLGPLLAALARHPVRDLVVPEPDLEEAFAGHYRGGAEGRP
jgi:ABC-2 type transport system ATP-binding protein